MEHIEKLNLEKDRKEIQPRGSAAFPFSTYESVMKNYELGYLEWHWHTDFQFVYLTSGTCTFRINNYEFLLSEGMGIFINSNCLHMAESEDKNATLIHVIFDPSVIAGCLGSVIDLRYVSPIRKNRNLPYILLSEHIAWQKEILEYLHAIYDLHVNEESPNELDVTILLLHIWKLLFDHLDQNIRHGQPQDNYERIKIILAYIMEHYQNPLTLEEIAAQIHLSKVECCKFFKKHMNCTIFSYLNDYRLRQAATALLNEPQLSVSEIAYRYGFSSTSSFIEKFRKKTGLTPLKYRKGLHN